MKHPAASVVVGVLLLYFALLPILWWVLDRGNETLNFTTAYFLFANFIVVWWYAWLTGGILEQTRSAARAAAEQTTLARERAITEHKLRWTDRKPLVFTFAREGHLWISNVGGGPALNVFYLSAEPDDRPMGLGALGVGQERRLLSGLDQPTDVWRHILIAEGIAPRTRRWNPTLNVGIGTSLTAHEIGPLHDPVKIGDDAHWTLDTFLEKTAEKLQRRLAKVTLPAIIE